MVNGDGGNMYLGARKITSVNTLMNIAFFICLLSFYNGEMTVYMLFVSFIVMISYYLFNVYNLEKGKYRPEDLMNSAMCNAVFYILSFKITFFSHIKEILIFSFIFQNMSKIIFYYFCVKNKKILIIGQNSDNEELKNIIDSKDYYTIGGEITFNATENLDMIIKQKSISKIVITEDSNDSEFAVRILNQKLKGIQVFDYLSFYEKLEEKVPVKSINEKWILFGSGYDILHKNFNIRVKRIFDIICAIVIGIITLPIMFISAIIIRIESKGPVIYSQERVGLGNEEFEIYKFRSMSNDAEKNGAQWAQEKDPRVTRFGNFMRKTRIDELPQLWNVLRGDMTFVGPRPERMVFIKDLEKTIPFYNIRHCVKPGLTGWAQVRYPYGASVEDAHQKLQYDLYYIKHQNLAFDLMILFKTVKIVLFGSGR